MKRDEESYWKTILETCGVYVTRKSAKTRSVKTYGFSSIHFALKILHRKYLESSLSPMKRITQINIVSLDKIAHRYPTQSQLARHLNSLDDRTPLSHRPAK